MNKRLLWLALTLGCFTSCQNNTPNGLTSQQPQSQLAQTAQNISYEIIPGQNKTFGYDISVNGKKLIHQEHIPAVSGTLGFKTAEEAQKVAEFLIEKMKKGESLPAISPAELKQLGVL